MQLTSLSLALTRAGLLAFSPASLFAAGEQGVWYDPSDLSTLFQDAAGTTPVTAVEQPVGLMLDKSKGLVLGPELVPNGTFDANVSGWTANTGFATITWEAGAARFIGTLAEFAAIQSTAFATVPGKSYTATVRILENTGAQWRLLAATSGGVSIAGGTSYAGAGDAQLIFTATTNQTVIQVRNATGATTSRLIDNISVCELPGNHATQTTSTSRPVLSARYNLLTKTEQLDDAVWTKSNATVTANAAVAPDGTMTASRLIETGGATGNKQVNTTVTLGGGNFYTCTLRVKPNGRNSVYVSAGSTSPWGATGSQRGVYVNLTTGVVFLAEGGTTATATVGSDGWVLIVVNFPITTTGGGCFPLVRLCLDDGTFSYTGDGTSGIYIWGASLVPANQADLPYQRVNTATDYDADPAKFPSYLKFDGVDDGMVTNSIDFTGTDKMTVFAGVRKLSDAAAGTLAELSTNPNLNSAFAVFAPYTNGGADYGGSSRATTVRGVAATGFPAPTTDVVSLLADIQAPFVAIRVAGVERQRNLLSQGAGPYGNYPLYIGRRGGTTLPFNGHLYSLVVRGAATTDAKITQAERWVAKKTGVTL